MHKTIKYDGVASFFRDYTILEPKTHIFDKSSVNLSQKTPTNQLITCLLSQKTMVF